MARVTRVAIAEKPPSAVTMPGQNRDFVKTYFQP